MPQKGVKRRLTPSIRVISGDGQSGELPREQMLAILGEFAGHVPQAIESARRTLPADFSSHVWQAITENMLKLHARLQQGLQAL